MIDRPKMRITIEVSEGRVMRKLREYGLDYIRGLDPQRAAELLAESVFFLPAEEGIGSKMIELLVLNLAGVNVDGAEEGEAGAEAGEEIDP